MKMLLMLLSLLLSVACGDKQSSKSADNEDLTLQLKEKRISGELRAELMLCDGKECYNALRERDGDRFYLDLEDTRKNKHVSRHVTKRKNVHRDHRQVHRDHHRSDDRGRFGSSQHVGIGYHSPHVGVTFANGSLRLSYRYNKHVSYQSRNHHRVRISNRYDAGVRRSKRKDNDDYADTVGTVAERAELIREIAEDRHWEEREKSLHKLFEDGDKIWVDQDEARRLLEIVADYFDVKIDREAKELVDLN